jgi:alginate O-acetyltransferase complex protein AlgI
MIFGMSSVIRSHILSRSGFALLSIAASALLSLQIGGSLLSLGLFGINVSLVLLVSLVLHDIGCRPQHRRWLAPLTIAFLVGVFIFSRFGRLQFVLFGTYLSRDGEWVGLSYLLFRLIHVIVDSPKLNAMRTDELAAYTLFPPALVAGPIHRAEQFMPQLDQPHHPAGQPELIDSLWRLGLGAGKKLVLANALGLYALTPAIASNPALPPVLLWLSLLAYTFMLYFDFSGYSDIAIGAAGLLGIRLPENFANPYAQSSITEFWQSWHITLSLWLRYYIFFPISRRLLRYTRSRHRTLVMATSHLTTMAVAGLWHGFGAGFLIWGLWHGTGLFIHAQWSARRGRNAWFFAKPVGIAMTFLFVMIGWVFFALPDLHLSVHFLARLLGR